MRYLSIIAILAWFASCNNDPESNQPVSTDSPATIRADSSGKYIHTFTDTVLEAKITDALMKLPFVKKSNDYIDSFSNHRHGISFMMDEAKENEVTVRAGYNGGERFETYYHFVVDPKTIEIKVYDPVDDKTLTLKEFLKTQR